MTFCPIYKDQCPENAGMCTFWNITIVPSKRSKRCKNCQSADFEECDYCGGYTPEYRREGCTLKKVSRE